MNAKHAAVAKLDFFSTTALGCLAIGVALAPATAHAQTAPSSDTTNTADIIVTAQKRSERLLDTPVPVTQLQSETLIKSNMLRLQDYYTSIPNFIVTPTPSAGGEQLLTIRGITTGFGNPTVGITVDDVPYGGPQSNFVPDIDPGELASVEVLRGPQGTLYGASSMGGLVKFVTVDPTTNELSGRVESGASAVAHSGQAGYNFRGFINIPVSNTLAVNASAFTRRDPGYIDNPVIGKDDVNVAYVSGGKLSALWRPTDIFSVKLSGLYQKTKGDGANDVDVAPGLSGLQQNYFRNIGGYDRSVLALSGVVKAKLGSSELTSLTGYNSNHVRDSLDYSYLLGGIANSGFPPIGFNGYGVSGSPLFSDYKTNSFTQELRLSIPLSSRINWLVGGFFNHASSTNYQAVQAEDTASGAIVGPLVVINKPSTYREFAIYTDLTYKVTESFDVQLGLRQSWITLKNGIETDTGPIVPLFYGVSSPRTVPGSSGNNQALTYLITPRYKIAPNIMAYLRFSSGYRPGNINVGVAGVPAAGNPDKTINYEAGLKGEFFDKLLTVDTSVYYIDWKNIQILLSQASTGLNYYGNGGGAKSEGVEVSLELHPWQGGKLSSSFAVGDAKLTSDLPITQAYGPSGSRLPYYSRFSGTVGFDQSLGITADLKAIFGATLNYVGHSQGLFTATAADPRQDYPSYARLNLNLSLETASWRLGVYANNVTDKRALIGGGTGTFPPYAFTVIQPRTVGVNLGYRF